MLSDIVICLFPDLTLPWAMEVPPQYPGCCRSEMGFSSSMAHSWGSRAPSHPLTNFPFLPPQEKSGWASSITLCHLGGGAALSKFHLPCLMRPNSLLFFFFCCNEVLESLFRKPGLLQGSLVVHKPVPSRYSGTTAKRGWSGFTGSCWFHGLCQGLPARYPIPPRHRPRLVYGHMVCISQLPQRYFCS